MSRSPAPLHPAGPAAHFFVDDLSADEITLSEPDTRHGLRSLRLRIGETIGLADDRGSVAIGRLQGTQDGLALIHVERRTEIGRPVPHLSVALAPPTGERLSWAVQKLSELGVDETVLIETEHSVRRWPKERRDQALERMRSVAREAAMQSRRPFVMRLFGVSPLQEVVDPESLNVLLWERATIPVNDQLEDDARRIRLFVGPEGGFSDQEADSAIRAGARPASLGAGTLRTETAAIAASAVVLARYGRLG